MRLLLVILVACSTPPPTETAVKNLALERIDLTPRAVHARIWRKGPKHVFEGSPQIVQRAVGRLVRQMWIDARAGREPERPTIREAAIAGFKIEVWTIRDTRYAALVEGGERQHGYGAYIVRLGPPGEGREVLLQAPHAFYDKHTDEIARALFFHAEKGARGLFVNTRQRYANPGGKNPRLPHLSLDVCHNAEHPYTPATLAALTVDPHLRVVQLHGFGAAAGEPEIILSAGRKQAPRSILGIRDTLRELGWQAGAYPQDIKRLGGTTNAQGKLVRRFDTAEFVHVELAAPLRHALRKDRLGQQRLARALFP